MKKLKLDLQQFEGAEVLTRRQLKQILGGFGGGTGSGDGGGGGGSSCWCSHYTSGGFDWYTCGKTQSEAMNQADQDAQKYGNGHYCHDNCGVSDPCTA